MAVVVVGAEVLKVGVGVGEQMPDVISSLAVNHRQLGWTAMASTSAVHLMTNTAVTGSPFDIDRGEQVVGG